MVICGTPPRRSGHVTGSDCTDSQADNAGSIPVTTPREKPRSVRQSRAWASSVHAVPGVRANWPAISLLETGAPTRPSLSSSPGSQSGWTCESIASVSSDRRLRGRRGERKPAWVSCWASPNVGMCGENYDWSR